MNLWKGDMRVISKFFIILISFNFVCIKAFANSCEDLKKAWEEKYIKDIQIALSEEEFKCKSDTGKLAQALYDLETITYIENKYAYKPNFYSTLKSLVKEIVYDSECKSLASAKGQHITLCSRFFNISREDKTSTLVHEMRHLEEDDQGHVACVGGAYDGDNGACDKKFYDGSWEGSGYNADVHYLGWTMVSSKPNELSKSVMQSHMNTYVPDRFNNITAEETKRWRKK